MSHYYDRHGDVGNNIDESGYMQEAELVDTYKTNRKMLKRMKRSLGICIEKYKMMKSLYKLNSNFKFSDQKKNDLGIARGTLMLAQLYRVTALDMDDSDAKKDSRTAKARTICTQAQNMLSELDDNAGVGECMIAQGKISLAYKDLYPKDVHEFEHNMKHLAEACKWFKEAIGIFEWVGDQKKVAMLKMNISVIQKDLEFSNMMVRRLYVAEGREWAGSSKVKMTQEEAEDLQKEAQAIKGVYSKFDLDGSGMVDMTEFHEVAGALGTFPPLTDSECWEVLRQLGKPHLESQLSWKEFLCWWISGEVLLHEENFNHSGGDY